MIAVDLDRLAEIVGGQWAEPLPARSGQVVTSLSVDSRTVAPGSVFAALPGQHVDGHAFVATAFERGAVAAIVSRPVPEAAGPQLEVPDVLTALGQVARQVVDLAAAGGLQVVAITGSQGKTSTKDLLGAVLETVGPTVAPHGNLNNELGVPLTVARLEANTRFLVAEFGARGVGHIRYLCGLAPPRVGVVLNVGQAHLSEFGSRAGIARAKAELVEPLPASGAAVLNADDPLVAAMAAQTAAPVVWFSSRQDPGHPDALWANSIEVDRRGRARFDLHARYGGRSFPSPSVALQVTGRHQVGNAVAAAAAALAVGVDLEAAAQALAEAQPRSRWRMELTERADGVLVVNDSYNANPDSMRAALDTVAELGRSRPGRTWAVLGDMLELGDVAEAEHAALGHQVAELRLDRLVATGDYASTVVAGAVAAGMPAAQASVIPTGGDVADQVAAQVAPGDAVLVKASRGLALDVVAERLLGADRRPGRRPPDREDPA